MNLLTVPRKIAATEYRLLRLPITAVHRSVERRLAEDAPVRVTFERAVANADTLAGSVTGDALLQRRGSNLARKIQARGLANSLAEKASDRADEAQAALTRSRREAAARQKAVRSEAAAAEAAIEKRRAAEKATAEQEAAAQATAARATARRAAQAKRTAESAKAEAAVTAIEKRTATRAKAPKAQLARAGSAGRTAATKRADADRIGGLAAVARRKRSAR